MYVQGIFEKLPFPSLRWITRKYTNALLWSDMDLGNLEWDLEF